VFWNTGKLGYWLQPAILLLLVLLLILLDAFIWKKEDPLPILESQPAPADALWLGVHRDVGRSLTLTRYELSAKGTRWLYLFPANRRIEPVAVELIEDDIETGPLGTLSAEGRLLLLPEEQLSNARLRFTDPENPSETLLTLNLTPLEQ